MVVKHMWMMTEDGILDELANIAEKEGIDEVRKNFPEYYKLAVRKVYPKPEDYINFRKR